VGRAKPSNSALKPNVSLKVLQQNTSFFLGTADTDNITKMLANSSKTNTLLVAIFANKLPFNGTDKKEVTRNSLVDEISERYRLNLAIVV